MRLQKCGQGKSTGERATMSTTPSLSLSRSRSPVGSSALLASLPPKNKLPIHTTPNPPTLHPHPHPHPHPYPSLVVATRTRREASFALATLGLAQLFQPLAPVDAAENSSCSLTVAPSGLAFCDVVVGYGPEATKGQLIKAHYVGKLENGKVFDSSYGRGKPLTFRVGAGEVIKGWDEGILGGEGIPPMLTGGKRILKLPPQLGYGMRGAGCKGGSCIIPPDSTLFFDVEFVGKA